MLRGRGPRTRRAPPEDANVSYAPDIRPDPAQQRLVVRLHSLANPRSNAALAMICDSLNTLAVVYPRTNLTLVYEAPHVA
jgi:hypothetical protein